MFARPEHPPALLARCSLLAALVISLASCGSEDPGDNSGAEAGLPEAEPVKVSWLEGGELRALYRHGPAQASPSPEVTLFHLLSPEKSGVSFVNELQDDHPLRRIYILGFACGGIAIGDVDGDGRADIYCTGGPGDNVLYRQTGPLQFVDITSKAGVAASGSWSAGSEFVDVDNDGDLDIHVCNYDSPNLLYLNDGNGVFTEAGEQAGIAVRDASLSAHFADYDNDGDLDFYLLTNRLIRAGGLPTGKFSTVDAEGKPVLLPEFQRYYKIVRNRAGQYKVRTVGRPDRLFENDGKGRFRDVTTAAGIADRDYGLSATWLDADGDGLLDLYVANDFQDPDYLYRNKGDGTFENVVQDAMPHTTWFSMGSDAADMNNDGLIDLLVLDMAATTHYKDKIGMGDMSTFQQFMDHSNPRQLMRNALFVNSGTPRFLESAWLSGVAGSDWSWAVKLNDFDNDGHTDVFITNGMSADIRNPDAPPNSLVGREEWDYYRKSGLQKETNLAFRNLGDLRFENVASAWGLDHLGSSYASASGDLDRDGDIDLVVASLDEQVRIYRNDSGGHRVTFSLQGTTGNRFGLGATVRLESGGRKQMRFLNPMTGFVSCNEPIVQFGLGDSDTIDRLEIEWPGGRRQVFEGLEADTHYTIAEPADPSPALPQPEEPGERSPMFSPVPSITAAPHKETPFDDFALQPLLPNKLSQLGPGIAVGDPDGDGDEDFLVGAARSEALHLHRNEEGRISGELFAAGEDDRMSEDFAPLFFDANRDGDADLYVVSGGVEAESGSGQLRDRLYLNDGSGRYAKAPPGALPDAGISGGVAAAADFDRDGDLDLFVGGRLRRGEYPLSPGSHLLRNDSTGDGNAVFSDQTATLGPSLKSAGMVTSALWSDANGDGWIDLLLTIDWGPIRLLLNRKGTLEDVTNTCALASRTGWWNGIAGRDLDNDGDMDYIATNFGLNTKYHPSADHPARIYYGAFGENKKPRIVEAKVAADGGILPVRGKSCSQGAMPFVRRQFPTFHEFASATLPDIYSASALDKAAQFEVNTLESMALINDGKGNFQYRPLPTLAQISPGFGVVATEIDGDGRADVYLVQNFYHPQRETGKMAGGMSVLLSGDGSGSFREIWPNRSGLLVPQDAKGLSACDWNDDGWVDFAISVNDGEMRVFENRMKAQTGNGMLAIRLAGRPGNPTAVGARVQVDLTDGSSQADEVRAGGSYLSQSSASLFFGLGTEGTVEQILVRWPDGVETTHRPKAGERKLTITPPPLRL